MSLQRFPSKKLMIRVFFYSSKALYTIDFYKEYVRQILPALLSANGQAKKALVFDCDNTLWKGILGEDGIDKIAMSSQTPEGAVFEEVQSLALGLAKKRCSIRIM